MFAGSLKFDTKLDATGFQNGLDKITNSAASGGTKIKTIVAGLGITKLISTAINTITNSIDDAVSRIDTLNNFPKVMSNLNISAEDSEKAINKLSDRLTGLPTALDTAALSVQRLTSKNGDVQKSVDIFLALNNAILAGGASSEIQASAVEQISQAYARGKPDMVEWRSLMTAMPAQLKQVAIAMGYVDADALGEDLRNGNIEMDAFINTMVRLNEEGVAGFKTFEEQARNATGGIATAMTNMQTAVTRGMTTVIEAINKGLASIGMGSLADVISNSGKRIETVLNNVASVIPTVIQQIDKLKGAIIGVVGAITLYKGTLATIKLSNDILGGIQSIQKSRIQWSLLSMEMAGATNKQILFNNQLSETQKLFLMLKKINIVDKFSSISSGASNATQALGKFVSSHKIMSAGILGIVGVLGTLGAMLIQNGGDFGKTADQIKEMFSNVIGVVSNIASQIPSIISNLISSISNFITTQGPAILNSVVEIGTKILNGITTLLPQILPAIVNFLSVTLPNLILSGATTISNLITQFANKLPEIINQILPVITDALSNGLPKLVSMWADGLTNIVGAITDVLPQVITAITEIIPSVIETISQVLPQIITAIVSMIPIILPPLLDGLIQLITALVNMIPTILPVLIQGMLAIIMAIVSSLGTILPPLITALIQASIMIINAIVQALPQIIMALVGALPQIISALVEGLIKCVPTLISAGIQIIGMIVKSIPQIIVALIKAIPGIVKSMGTALKNNWKEIFNAGLTLIKKLWDGFKSWVSNLLSNVWDFAKSIPEKIVSGIGKIADIGKNLVQGIWEGINNAKDWVLDKIKGFGSSVVDGIKSIFGINSPSKVMRDEIGRWLPSGIAVGIEANTDSALKAIDNMSDAIYKELQNSVIMDVGNIQGEAFVNANYGISNTFTIDNKLVADVLMDKTKVGQLVTPVVSKTLKTAGVR